MSNLSASEINDIKGKATACVKELVGCDLNSFGIEDKKAGMKKIKTSVKTRFGTIEAEVDIGNAILKAAGTSPQTAAFVASRVANSVQRAILNQIIG